MVSITWIAAHLRAIVGAMRSVVILPSAAALALTLCACTVRELPPIETSYVDSFDQHSISGDYRRTGGGYRLVDGALQAHGAHNHPLWLAKRLPPGDLQIDLDAWSTSPYGDMKIEVFGDGKSY